MNHIFLKKNYIVFFCLLLCHCLDPLKAPPAKPLILDKNSISLDQNILSGTGRVLFPQALFGLFSKELYLVNAKLTDEDSFLVLQSHFTGFSKQDGIKVFFKRTKNTLTITISTPSYPPQMLMTQENYFLNNQHLKLYLEITNGSKNFIEIKIWDTYINRTGHLKQPTDFFSTENLMADSQNMIFYSKGQGVLWGVEMHKAQLKKITRNHIEQ